MNTTTKYNYVDVVLPLSLRQFYSYSIPEEIRDEVELGKRVVVQFGKSKLYSAIVIKIHNNKPSAYETKAIEYVLDKEAIVTKQQLDFWLWLSQYYMSSVGEIYRAALPTGLRLESELKIAFNTDFNNYNVLKPKESELISLLQNTENLSIGELSKLLNKKQILPLVKSLQEKGAVSLSEKIKQNYKPKYETYIKLNAKYNSKEAIALAFEQVSRSQKQENLLLSFLSISTPFSEKPKRISKKLLLKQSESSTAILSGLIKKDILDTYQEAIARLKPNNITVSEKKELSENQTIALEQIKTSFQEKDTVLLHGVTASGKTEVYIHLIEDILAEGKTVLYLLPEIALTSQIIDRLANVFGDKIGIYHSKYNDSERVELWKEMLKGKDSKYQIILGVRSSIFLPFHNLGLIIVDEEHENTFKQYNPSPRYHARDSAIVLAKQQKAKILLGTATPSIESYYNTQQKRFDLVELNERHLQTKLPEIQIVDLREARKRKQMNSHFSSALLEEIKNTLENKKQIILFQNRRGYSPFVECSECGWVPQCEHCDVSLTYHKFSGELKCHYCGYLIKNPTHCLACGSPAMQTKGFGTEKIEDEIQIFFPENTVARFDLDSTRKKNAAEEIIYKFENGDIDILIGTQMITKGLDFKNVGLVAILNADNLLNYPDFRAEERSFQLLTQVSGRAGRKDGLGKVIIQTSQPEHKIIQQVLKANFKAMFEEQMQERYEFAYPPYVRLLELTLKHKMGNVVNNAAHILCRELREQLPNIPILGPQPPVINRIQNMYLQNILIKLPKTKSINQYKSLIINRIDALKIQRDYRSIVVQINVDPF